MAYINDNEVFLESSFFTSEANPQVGSKTYYGTCSNSGSVLEATTSSDFELKAGVIVTVKFTYSGYDKINNAGATLNVNGTGAKKIMLRGTTGIRPGMWAPGSVVSFVYDGTNYVMENGSLATKNNYGITILSSATDSDYEYCAATPAAVNAARTQLQNSKADKTYVDTELAKKLDKTGGTVTGNLGASSLLIGDVTFTQTDFTGAKEIAIGNYITTNGISLVEQTPGDEGGDYNRIDIADSAITLSTSTGFTKRIFADDTSEILHIDAGTAGSPCVLRGVDTPVSVNDAANKAYVDSKAGAPAKTVLDWYWEGIAGGSWSKDANNHPYKVFTVNGADPNNDNQVIQLAYPAVEENNNDTEWLSAMVKAGMAITNVATNSVTVTALNVNYDELEAEDGIFDADITTGLFVYIYNY